MAAVTLTPSFMPLMRTNSTVIALMLPPAVESVPAAYDFTPLKPAPALVGAFLARKAEEFDNIRAACA
jgi:hypothetical protein